MPSQKRSRLLIDAPVQLMLVRRVLVHWLLFFALFILCLVTLEYFLREPGTNLWDSLNLVLSKYTLLFLLIAALLPVFIYDTLKMSHRFAGPVYRLKKSMKSLAEGEQVPPLKFRSKDFWSEISSDFNRIAHRLDQCDLPSPK